MLVLRALLLGGLWSGGLLSLGSCSCDPPPVPPPAVTAAGSVRVDAGADTGAVSVVLVGLDQPLRAFQVDVDVAGGNALAALGVGPDIVEAGLAPEDGGPKNRFTLVVSDTRRLPLNNGVVGRLAIDNGATVTLTKAFGIDQQGQKRPLTVVAP